MIEAIVIFRGDLPPSATIGATSDRPAMFDATAVSCSPEMFASYLDDPSQPLDEAERHELADEHVGIRLLGHTDDPWRQLPRLVEQTSALIEHGACAVVLPAALRVFGAAQLGRALLEPTDVERWLALFVHHHAVDQGERVWLHTHGMQHFGLPDVECVELLQLAGNANRAIRAVLRRLVAGPPLHIGDVIEHDTATARFRIVPSIPVLGHGFGVHDVVRLDRVAV